VIQEERNRGLMKMNDNQVCNAAFKHNSIPIKTMLMCLQEKMCQITGKRLESTYCYTRIYYHGAVLKPHHDRASCEYSATVHLAGTHTWPFFVEDLETGVCNSVVLHAGDALIYRGCDVLHYREEYEGDWYIQVFLHYIDVDGMHSEMSKIENTLPQLTHTLPPFVQLFYNADKHIYHQITAMYAPQKINRDNAQIFVNCKTTEQLRIAQKLTNIQCCLIETYTKQQILDIHQGAHDVLYLREPYHFMIESMLECVLHILWVLEGNCKLEFSNYEASIKLESGQAIVFPCSFTYRYNIQSPCVILRSFMK
jgi:hypothetical protein